MRNNHITNAQGGPSIVIVGAGFAGLGMAMELERAGFHNITILERADGVGGVWRENTYPGAACDTPSPLYSFSYEPKANWPKRFSEQPDILQYLEGVAEKYDLLGKIQFSTEVTETEFSEQTGTWTIRVSGGAELTADVLIMATGQLSRPALPELPGIGDFEGPAFHSAEWDHSVDLEGKRVAVVGTGASAIQFVPQIVSEVSHLTLFQRSAAWVLPKPDVEYTPLHHTVLTRIPPVRLAERFLSWGIYEFLALALVDIPAIRPPVAKLALNHLHKQVEDEDLRAKLTPDYEAGCKRGLLSNDYYPALTRPNVTVKTSAITAVTPKGIVTVDGAHHEVDVIIYGTGFKGTEFLWPIKIFGRDRQALQDVWGPEGAHAYLGMNVSGFPNMFVMYGPNTNLGAGSIVYMLEAQARYIRQAVEVLAKRPGSAIEVRPEVEAEFNKKLQQRLDRSVWTLCSSWYRNAAGRITNNWPGTVSTYWLRTRRLKLSDFSITRAGKDA